MNAFSFIFVGPQIALAVLCDADTFPLRPVAQRMPKIGSDEAQARNMTTE